MTSISAAQLRCTFPRLSAQQADRFARAVSQRMGRALGNRCAWAAFLGNVGDESAGLTLWTQVPCNAATDAPFCGRGPLQITGRANYRFCASRPVCNCPGIERNPQQVSNTEAIGWGTTACVWQELSGHSLTRHADGTENGLLRTACLINWGRFPCGGNGLPNGWQQRRSYWRQANQCLSGARGRAFDPYLANCTVGIADESRDLIPWSVQQTALDGSFDSPTLMPQFQRGGLQELVLDSTQQWNGSALAPVATSKCTDTITGLEYKGAMRTTVGASVMSPVTSLVTAYRGVVGGDSERAAGAWCLTPRVAQRFRLAWIHANASHQAKKSHFQLPHCHTPIPVQVWPSTCSPCRTTFLSFTTMLPALRSRAARWDEP